MTQLTPIPGGTPRTTGSRPTLTALVVLTGVFLSSLDLFIVNIAFPSISKSFHGESLSSMSWVLSAYTIVFASLLVPAGRWADRAGRKRAFLIGLGIFTASSALCAVAPSLDLLVAARILQAGGGALMLPTSLGLLLPAFGPARKGAAIGLWSAVGGAAAAFGPPIGGILVQASWRWVFLVNLPFSLIALVVGVRVLREIKDPAAHKADLAGAALLSIAVASLAAAIVEGSNWGWTSASILGAFALAVVTSALLVVRSGRHPNPIIEPAVIRHRAVALADVSSLVFFAGFGAMVLGGVLFLTGVWHEPILRAGFMIAPGPLVAALCAFPGGLLGARFSHRSVGTVGSLIGGQPVSHVAMDASLTRNVWTAIEPDIETPALKRIVTVGNSTLPPEDALVAIAYLARAYLKHPPQAQFNFLVSPLVFWIWIGGLIGFGGGLIALWPAPSVVRRRVAARSRARALRGLARA